MLQRLMWVLPTLGYLPVSPATGRTAPANRTPFASVARDVRDYMHAEHIPGMSVAIAVHGRLVWAHGFLSQTQRAEHDDGRHAESRGIAGGIGEYAEADTAGSIADVVREIPQRAHRVVSGR